MDFRYKLNGNSFILNQKKKNNRLQSLSQDKLNRGHHSLQDTDYALILKDKLTGDRAHLKKTNRMILVISKDKLSDRAHLNRRITKVIGLISKHNR